MGTEATEPLRVEPIKGLPKDASRGDTLAFAVRYAVQAPSARNSQPWLFRLTGDHGLELWADRERALPVVDPHGRELTIGCGAALHHLRVALRHLGFAASVELVPDERLPDLLARVSIESAGPPSYDDNLLFWAIHRRHTNRKRFTDSPVARELVEKLVDAGASEGAPVAVASTEPERAALAALVAEADRRQADDPAFRR